MQEDDQYLALCKWKAERTCRMKDHRSQDRWQKKKKKVEIYTYRTATNSAIENATTRLVITATGSAIENAAPRLVITATSSAIENVEAGFAGELKCKIVVSDRRTHRQPELIYVYKCL
jgi:hypothetical protein